MSRESYCSREKGSEKSKVSDWFNCSLIKNPRSSTEPVSYEVSSWVLGCNGKKKRSTYYHGSKGRVLEEILDIGMSVTGCLICSSLLHLVLNYIDANGDRDQNREKKVMAQPGFVRNGI